VDTLAILVTDMSCEHCANALRDAIAEAGYALAG